MATHAQSNLSSIASVGGARAVDGVAAPSPGPRHVAIIMDGNGRWAKKRLLPRIAGHRAGVEAVRRVARAAQDMGLECLTLYAFSSENWKRPASEVADLMGLLRHFIQSDIEEFHANGVRLKVIGDYRALDPSLVTLAERATPQAKGFCSICAADWVPVGRSGEERAPIGPRFMSVEDLFARTGLRRDELTTLAEIGALNSFGYDRRSALWQAERAVRPSGELFENSLL